MIDWNIQSRAHHCQACEQKFADKQAYHTVLCDEKHEYQRVDVCETCWQAQYSDGAKDRKGFISQWQGVYHAPPAQPPEAIQKDTAETLLRKLTELNDPKHAATCYILAVMLERKRLLKIQSQFRQDGKRVFVYEQPKTGDIFTIPDPDLQLDQLQQVQHDVAFLLEHGLPGNEAAAQPADGTAPETPASDEPSDEVTAEQPAEAETITAEEVAAAETPASESASPDETKEPASAS